MAFHSFVTVLLVLECVYTVYSATITRASVDGSEWVVDIKNGKKVECQGVQLSKEKILALEGCVNTKSLKKYSAVVSGETRKITSVQTSDDNSLILLTTTTKKDKKTKFPGIASSTKGYDRVAYISAKKGFSEVAFKAESAKKCKKPLNGFNQKSQECLSSDTECTYPNGLPIFGVSGKKIVISSFALDSLCSSTYKASISVVKSRSWIEDNIEEEKDCGKLPKIKGGSYVLDNKKDTSVGATASVKCGKGLVASQKSIECQSSGKWEEATCEEADCGKKLPKLEGGSYVLDNKKDTSVGATASVKCGKGLVASQKSIECQVSGEWEEATCEKADCGKKLPKLEGGSYVLDNKKDTSVGATASVKCGKGLVASQKSIECQVSGEWEEATCEKADCGKKLPNLKDGSYVLDNKKDTSFGATASVKCDDGFEASQKKIECQESGDWEEAQCEAKDCGSKLPKVSDGTIILDNKKKTTFGSTATVTCNEGYESKDKKITCEASGKWGKASCDIVDCGELPKIKDGSYKLDKKKLSTFEATATLTCDEDFFVKNDDDSITCEASGDWSKIGKCDEVKDCGKLKSLDNGKYVLKGKKTKAGAKAAVKCDDGYDADEDEIECLPTGKWETAKCIIRDCGSLPAVSKGSLKLDKKKASTVGETATLTCESGYEPKNGKSSITCQTSGKWEKTSCAIKDCGKPGNLKNGVYNEKGTTFGSKAVVACNKGYDASQKEIDCLASGKWEKATCIIKDCGKPGKLTNGDYIEKGTTFGSKAEVDCDAGYDESKSEIECQASGKWEKATCDIKDCGSVGSLTNGKYELSSGSTTYKSTANVVCNVGYGSIAKTISCLQTGSWSSAECEIDCGSVPPSLEFGNITIDDPDNTLFGASASVTCIEGYDASASSITCLDSGDWISNTTCTIHDCGPPSFKDISVTLDNSNSTTTYGETATVTCPGKLVPAMGKTITCQGDGWETPTCVADPCSSGWTLYDSHCYYYEAFTSDTWSNANTLCGDGYLAEISSEEEGNFLNRLRDSSMSAWIGLSDQSNTNTYKWAQTNSEPSYTNWNDGQPSASGKCAVMNPIGSWDVQDCTKSRNSFCENDNSW